MEYTSQVSGDTKTYILSGQINFKDDKKFAALQMTIAEDRNTTGCVLDLSAISFIDSSGLGMLLTLRDLAEKYGNQITLRKPQEKVMRVFRACKFDTLFCIED